MKRIFLISIFIFTLINSYSQNANWIAYPGEFGIWTHKNQMQGRTERNQNYPSMWRVDSPHSIIEFTKYISLDKPERA